MNLKNKISFVYKEGSESPFRGYLKEKHSLMIFDRHAHLKFCYGNRKFWCRDFYVGTVGRNKKQMQEYIRNQLREDYVDDQLTLNLTHSREKKTRRNKEFFRISE
ncbi:hypothetical protein J27TS8_33390 [Robertmurraya siralis]|uniref:Transposase IS200-like domain-containing protein n=1 Tax=Robertmurraya siralis TaxID=77777 RepID=A0A919WKF1_9BACI|nr:hypothetical protein J27TS8_33390 [Robertmurraya siralis]